MRREWRERFTRHLLQRKLRVGYLGMNHDMCVKPWCMSGSLTQGGGENVLSILGACATRNFAYLVRDPWSYVSFSDDNLVSVCANSSNHIFCILQSATGLIVGLTSGIFLAILVVIIAIAVVCRHRKRQVCCFTQWTPVDLAVNLKNVISEHMIQIKFLSIFCEIALR